MLFFNCLIITSDDQDAQQSDMMDLEIADYERTVHALNAQLSDRDSHITDLKAEINRVEERVQLMQTQIGTSVSLFLSLCLVTTVQYNL